METTEPTYYLKVLLINSTGENDPKVDDALIPIYSDYFQKVDWLRHWKYDTDGYFRTTSGQSWHVLKYQLEQSEITRLITDDMFVGWSLKYRILKNY